MTRVETLGSFWEFDEVDMRYRRWPKNETPRARAEWSDERAGPFQDFVWHPYSEWAMTNRLLYIELDGRLLGTAPEPRVLEAG